MSLSTENVDKHIFATFILRGNGLDPYDVSSSLGIIPSKSFKRGDWRTETEKWTRNLWSLTSQNVVQSDNLSVHIEWLLDQLEPVNNKLIEILERNGIESEISCFWIFPTEHEEFELSSQLMKRIASLGVKLSFDMYSSD
jgi:hypothetical protein